MATWKVQTQTKQVTFGGSLVLNGRRGGGALNFGVAGASATAQWARAHLQSLNQTPREC
jgi:hypothetical protein